MTPQKNCLFRNKFHRSRIPHEFWVVPYTKLYDKSDDFKFHIVNFPFLSSNIPSWPSCGVYISQLLKSGSVRSLNAGFTYYDDFGYNRRKFLVNRLLSQDYKVNLRNSFQKFHSRYPDLVTKYQKSVKDMMNDSSPF